MYNSQVSVRQMVEFIYQCGDLDLRFRGTGKMTDGIKIHQKIQKSQGKDYQSEVSLSECVILQMANGESVELQVSGRADGILTTDEGVTVDEIKGTSFPLEAIDETTFPIHWAQAKIYGAIYAKAHQLKEMTIQITYADFEDKEVKRLQKQFTLEELRTFFYDTVERYKKWVYFKATWLKERNASCVELSFPFKTYREGQRAIAIGVYNAIRDGEVQFIQAATGTGKTLSTLFPAIKSLGESLIDRIFYLSAKATAKIVAEEAIERLRKHDANLKLKVLTLTAKEKLCLNDEMRCNPEKCPFAKGHYDRNLNAMWDILNQEDVYNQACIVDYAQKHQVCPYEFSLDIALFSDVIICDYNYAFDPRVYLRRFFDVVQEEYAFLVDEAHNLVDRARNMYSATLEKRKFTELAKKIPEKDKALKTIINGMNRVLVESRRKCDEEGIYVNENSDETIYEGMKRRIVKYEKWLTQAVQSPVHDEALDLYFDWMSYMRTSELYNESYLSYIIEGNSPDTQYKLFCIHPASILSSFINNAKSVIFFSATLSPIKYYQDMLYPIQDRKPIDVPSPFNPANRYLGYITDISVKYQDRDSSLLKVCGYIYAMASAQKGNYMVFFPSYKYMNDVKKAYAQLHEEEHDILVQQRETTELERLDFLEAFKESDKRQKSLVSFVVMGSHFSEGIDLHGNQLIGVMIIGVGLPMFSFEGDLIKKYFDEKNGYGFEFAYQFPGINKVMQSAGRVIRTETDEGVIFLMDSRYSGRYYRRYFPESWGFDKVESDRIQLKLKTFWEI